ncbi:MAG: hypothetical protein V7717_05925 [Porticoccaceae bacterium]
MVAIIAMFLLVIATGVGAIIWGLVTNDNSDNNIKKFSNIFQRAAFIGLAFLLTAITVYYYK